MATEFLATLEQFENDLWSTYLHVPQQEAIKILAAEHRRAICTFPDGTKIHCALMPRADNYFILINKEIRKKLGVQTGDSLLIHLETDTSDYGMPMPEEMQAALDSDPLGSEYFHALTPGKQRSLLYLVGKFKSPEVRLRKAVIILRHLNETGGTVDYKGLNRMFSELKDL